jgi:hypothetical protein
MQEGKRARRRESSQPEPRPSDGLQGEGNRAADRRYREKASEFARSPRAREAAEEAERAIDEAEILGEDAGPTPDDHDPDRYDADVEREQPGRVERERR